MRFAKQRAGYTRKNPHSAEINQKAAWTLITVPWTSMKRDSCSLWIFDSVYEVPFCVYGCRVVIFIDHPSSGHALTRGLLFSVSKARARGGTDTIGPVKAFVMWNPCCMCSCAVSMDGCVSLFFFWLLLFSLPLTSIHPFRRLAWARVVPPAVTKRTYIQQGRQHKSRRINMNYLLVGYYAGSASSLLRRCRCS